MINCKECGKEITRCSKSGFCKSCSHRGRVFSLETRAKISAINKGRVRSIETRAKISLSQKERIKIKGPGHAIPHSAETCKKMSAAHIGKILSLEIRKKMSDAQRKLKRIGTNAPNYGNHHSVESRAKIGLSMRLLTIERINKNMRDGHQLVPNWNPIACQKIEEYARLNGYNFQHAMNGGEYFIPQLGYWVDGYDENRNTVIEYYEKRHNNQIQEDLNRETEICNHLGCDFIILREE